MHKNSNKMERRDFTDAIGNTHPQAVDPRIVSLVPSITELLFDLGLEANVVGRTAFCVHPKEAVKNIRIIGGTKQINMDKLRAVDATHAIVNIDENPKEMAKDLAAMGIAVIATHPEKPEDNIELFNLLGGIFNRGAEAQTLCVALNQALDEIRDLRKTLPSSKVLYLIWKDPWITVSQDTYASQMLALINWQTVGHNPEVRYPAIDHLPRLLEISDRVLFSSEPYSFTSVHIEDFRTAFSCAGKRLQKVDGEMVTWYGSRAIKAIRYLGELATS